MGQAAERGLYMIEIIREESFDSEQEKRELPKNIRQIGSPDIGDRIYIENKVHASLRCIAGENGLCFAWKI